MSLNTALTKETSSAFSARRRGPPWLQYGATMALVFSAASSCVDSTPTAPNNIRFGQEGEIRIQLVKPLPGTTSLQGELQQVLTWNSEGPWQLFESVSYRGQLGDETLVRGTGNAASYAQLIVQVNETTGLKLLSGGLDPDVDPVCEGADGRISILIRDNLRDQEMRWVRCTGETLENLSEAVAGPDPAAARLITAARRSRDLTLSDDWRSAYSGSVPFGSLDRGEQSQAALTQPQVFLGRAGPGGTTVAPIGWDAFWSAHTGTDGPPPEVDWEEDIVLVAALGQRQEAGDSVEIRRILRVESGTVVDLYQRVPGDFCSPAAQLHTPFHIVIAPKTRPVFRFGEATVERVPCGG
jgi:hypothetical protein